VSTDGNRVIVDSYRDRLKKVLTLFEKHNCPKNSCREPKNSYEPLKVIFEERKSQRDVKSSQSTASLAAIDSTT
jgi:hypothetical protein